MIGTRARQQSHDAVGFTDEVVAMTVLAVLSALIAAAQGDQ
ncbi:hypothetical protein [Bradyrhizobium elkanii]|nr:hypothetical protein [Bradyrhizobium elkanii]